MWGRLYYGLNVLAFLMCSSGFNCIKVQSNTINSCTLLLTGYTASEIGFLSRCNNCRYYPRGEWPGWFKVWLWNSMWNCWKELELPDMEKCLLGMVISGVSRDKGNVYSFKYLQGFHIQKGKLFCHHLRRQILDHRSYRKSEFSSLEYLKDVTIEWIAFFRSDLLVIRSV